MPVGPGAILQNRYEVVALLDHGGMGQVWRGEDVTLKRGVAIKIMQADNVSQDSFDRFVREAQVAAGLDHPGITSVYDFGRHEGQYFIVMQLLRGQDLKAKLKEHPVGLPVPQAVSYAIQAAEALAVAHEAGVVHRDLKPANLFIVAGDRLKICDFGIAKNANATRTLTRQGEVMGTPAYMSPEQWEGKGVDERSDLYSLGCLLYELLTGQPPFGSDLTVPALYAQHVQVMPQPPRRSGGYLPAPLSSLVLCMLAKDPAGRPQTAAGLAGQLRDIDLTEPAAAEGWGRTAHRSPAPWDEPRGLWPGPSFTPSQSPIDFGTGARDTAARRDPALQDFFAPADGWPGNRRFGASDNPDADWRRATAVARLRGWTITARVLAWLLCLTVASFTIGAPFGVESLAWLWVLVPVSVITALNIVGTSTIDFESGALAAWTLTMMCVTGGSTVAAVTGNLAGGWGVPLMLLSSVITSLVILMFP